MVNCMHIQNYSGVNVPDKDSKYPSDICAVVGRAVAQLISTNEAINKHSVLLVLHEHSEQTNDEALKSVYLLAFRAILERFH